MIEGIHHVAIIVSSEVSVAFYEKLGFKEYYRKKRNYDTVVLMEGNGFQIELFIDPNHPDRAVEPENIGLRHLAMRVDCIERTLEEIGEDVALIDIDWIGKRFCYISDPDGLPIELHE